MLSKRPANLQDGFLNQLRRQRIPITLFLSSGVQLRGQLAGFDSFVIILESPGKPTQLVYKHSIVSVAPAWAPAPPPPREPVPAPPEGEVEEGATINPGCSGSGPRGGGRSRDAGIVSAACLSRRQHRDDQPPQRHKAHVNVALCPWRSLYLRAHRWAVEEWSSGERGNGRATAGKGGTVGPCPGLRRRGLISSHRPRAAPGCGGAARCGADPGGGRALADAAEVAAAPTGVRAAGSAGLYGREGGPADAARFLPDRQSLPAERFGHTGSGRPSGAGSALSTRPLGARAVRGGGPGARGGARSPGVRCLPL